LNMRGFTKVSLNEYEKRRNAAEYENIRLPDRGTKHAAGYDFYLPYDVEIGPGAKVIIYTGIKAYMQSDEVLLITIRSSAAIKGDLRLVNHVAVIDSDYYDNPDNEGHIMIALENVGSGTRYLQADFRVAQGIFVKYLVADNETPPDKARTGGIGSTE
jgi:dUTP pyrophosphatase